VSVADPPRASRQQPEPSSSASRLELDAGWEMAAVPPGTHGHPGELTALSWTPAAVPGTAAGALHAAGQWMSGHERDFDAEEWWFRTRFALAPALEGERIVLGLDGLATVAAVYLNGALVLESASMFSAHELDVSDVIATENELSIRCLALAPLLAVARRPRARWRTRLVAERNLRFFRTMLLGRTPGFAAGPAVVGPYRPVWLARRRAPALQAVTLRSRLHGASGHVTLRARLAEGAPALGEGWLELTGPDATVRGRLGVDPDGWVSATLAVEHPARWWPHTHGTPSLYEAAARLRAGDVEHVIELGRVGFRTLESPPDVARAGIALEVNGVSVFARGAVWTPDLLRPHATPGELRVRLEAMRGAGMNMVRIPGIACYETDAFHDLCDELGILVWQDFMFANLDYPDRDPGFMDAVRAEAAAQLRGLGRHPSLAVLCGGSEVAQQAAMMGVDPLPAMAALYLEALPEAIARADVDVPYVPSTPWGGDQPFRPSRGVANYYGVGAYLRPLTDVRAARVHFAAECLAFANVPDAEAVAELTSAAGPAVHHPAWKRGVPRDVGAGWDFEDVRDHYLALLYGVEPVTLRSSDPDRYLDLSRQVSGEVMAEVMGEWRRAGSPCAGALVLWLRDLAPGAGWGVLDHRGRPKVAYHHLRRALAPLAVWSTDEGLDGVVAHVANDGPEGLSLSLRVSLYRDRETLVDEVSRDLCVAPHTTEAHNVEGLLGRFVDAGWAYRFAPPAQDLIVLTLEDRKGPAPRMLSQAFRHPAGRPIVLETASGLGLRAAVSEAGPGVATLVIASQRYAHGVRVHIDGYQADDDAFSIEPGRERTIGLAAGDPQFGPPHGHVSALNLRGSVMVAP
jgi:beta-mannosidase